MGSSFSTFLIALVLSVWLGLLTAVQAQQPPVAITVESLQAEVTKRDAVISDLVGQLSKLSQFAPEQINAITKARADALTGYYVSQLSYNRNGDKLREHQQRVFSWQMTAANWLLFVVILVSLAGVAFAGYEMISARTMILRDIENRRTIAQAARAAPAVPVAQARPAAADDHPADPAIEPVIPGNPGDAPDPALASPLTSILIEPGKVHITSAVIGIIILSLSLGFLYLFLREVYAINVIQITDTGGINLVQTREPGQESSNENQSEPEEKP